MSKKHVFIEKRGTIKKISKDRVKPARLHKKINLDDTPKPEATNGITQNDDSKTANPDVPQKSPELELAENLDGLIEENLIAIENRRRSKRLMNKQANR